MYYKYVEFISTFMISQLDTQRITATLKKFGCNLREVQIYLHCLSIGPVSVQQLAKELNQNRITVHSAVEQLIKSSLLFETRKGKRRLVIAENPTVLLRLWQQRQAEWETTRVNLEYVTKLLSTLQRTDNSVPTVKLYEGVDGLKRMLEETLNAKNEVMVFTYVDLFSKLLSPTYLEKYYIRRAAKNIHTRVIFPRTEFGKKVNEKSKKFNMQIRFLSPEIEWKSGIFSWNNFVAIQSFTEGKVTCTIIENEDIASFYRNVMYELCWMQARPMESGSA